MNSIPSIKFTLSKFNFKTPKFVGGLFVLFSIPQFIFFYQLFNRNYEDDDYFDKIKQAIDWFNIKGACMVKFINIYLKK